MKKKMKDIENINIDVTPMLNVLYILLFFFIICSHEEQVGIKISPGYGHGTHIPHTILVEVSDNGDIHIQKRYVIPRAVTATITRLKNNYPGGPVLVKVDRRAKTKVLVSTLDKIRQADVLLPSISII